MFFCNGQTFQFWKMSQCSHNHKISPKSILNYLYRLSNYVLMYFELLMYTINEIYEKIFVCPLRQNIANLEFKVLLVDYQKWKWHIFFTKPHFNMYIYHWLRRFSLNNDFTFLNPCPKYHGMTHKSKSRVD